jgi:hypothetical protein
MDSPLLAARTEQAMRQWGAAKYARLTTRHGPWLDDHVAAIVSQCSSGTPAHVPVC